jgi:chitinase
MIGRNDVDGEFFTHADASSLVNMARSVGLGRVSIWSANRDSQCSVSADTSQVSNVCSGIAQDALAFTWQLGRLNGSLPARISVPNASIAQRPPSRDDPRISPYPIWVPAGVYVQGSKVVWHGSVYEAKWYTIGSIPDQPVQHPWDTPWRDVGPILPADAHSPDDLVSGGPQHWSADQVYLAGDLVTDHGYVFQARWWTQGEEPVVHPVQPEDAAWLIIRRLAPPSSLPLSK